MTHRILHIIPSLAFTGAARQLALLAAGLPRDVLDVQVCVLDRPGPLAAELDRAGVPVVAMERQWPLDPRAAVRLRQHVTRLRPDLIHTWGFAAHAYGTLAAAACGVRLLVGSESPTEPPRSDWQSLAWRWIAHRRRATLVNTTAMLDDCHRHGLAPGTVHVIPAGVAPTAPTVASRQRLLDELGLPASSRLVGMMARLEARKGLKDAIWAADLLKVIRDDVHLVILGEGPQGDRLLRFREQVVIRDKVHFLSPRNDAVDWLPHFDLFWSTSSREGQSSAILEAMMAGLPVVATDIPGTRDLVLPTVTGYLVRPGHRAGIARWTNHLLDHGDDAQRLGTAGRQWACDAFSAAVMVRRHAELYRQLLNSL